MKEVERIDIGASALKDMGQGTRLNEIGPKPEYAKPIEAPKAQPVIWPYLDRGVNKP